MNKIIDIEKVIEPALDYATSHAFELVLFMMAITAWMFFFVILPYWRNFDNEILKKMPTFTGFAFPVIRKNPTLHKMFLPILWFIFCIPCILLFISISPDRGSLLSTNTLKGFYWAFILYLYNTIHFFLLTIVYTVENYKKPLQEMKRKIKTQKYIKTTYNKKDYEFKSPLKEGIIKKQEGATVMQQIATFVLEFILIAFCILCCLLSLTFLSILAFQPSNPT